MPVKCPEIILKVFDKPADSRKSILKETWTCGFLIQESYIYHQPLVAFKVKTYSVKSLDENGL